MEYTLIDNSDKKRFEFIIENQIAFVEYIKIPDKIYLTHTEVPQTLEGQGIGSALVKAVLDKIAEEELTLIPLCPFVAMYIKKNPEYRNLVLKGINIA